MAELLKTVLKPFSAEITEKKSRFIASLAPAKSEQDAADFIQQCRKTYRDARHNCSAYIIGADGKIKHSSDDGEPSGTAGKPMLALLEANGLFDVIAVVTRYFGGILLGTGGLVRAYSKALDACISSAELTSMFYGSKIKIEASYAAAGKLQYMFANKNVTVLSSDYTDKVSFQVIVPAEAETSLIKDISEATSDSAKAKIIERAHYTL